MAITLTKKQRSDAIDSIQTYVGEHLESEMGNIAAGAMLDYFLIEIGPSVYNKAISDAQERLQARILDFDIELHEEEFSFWPR